MKSKDLAPLIAVVFIAAIASFGLSKLIFKGGRGATLKVESVAPITADFPLPNETYFNKDSLNPTHLIKIGDETNQSPFK